MRVYEVLFIVAPNVEEGDIETLVTQFSDIATNQGAQVTKVDRMGRRRLAYPIGKFNEPLHRAYHRRHGLGDRGGRAPDACQRRSYSLHHDSHRRGPEASREVWRSPRSSCSGGPRT